MFSFMMITSSAPITTVRLDLDRDRDRGRDIFYYIGFFPILPHTSLYRLMASSLLRGF